MAKLTNSTSWPSASGMSSNEAQPESPADGFLYPLIGFPNTDNFSELYLSFEGDISSLD